MRSHRGRGAIRDRGQRARRRGGSPGLLHLPAGSGGSDAARGAVVGPVLAGRGQGPRVPGGAPFARRSGGRTRVPGDGSGDALAGEADVLAGGGGARLDGARGERAGGAIADRAARVCRTAREAAAPSKARARSARAERARGPYRAGPPERRADRRRASRVGPGGEARLQPDRGADARGERGDRGMADRAWEAAGVPRASAAGRGEARAAVGVVRGAGDRVLGGRRAGSEALVGVPGACGAAPAGGGGGHAGAAIAQAGLV